MGRPRSETGASIGLRERTASAIQVLQGASRIEESIPVVYRISDAFISLVPAVESANASLADLAELVAENQREIGHVKEAAEAGMAATTGPARHPRPTSSTPAT